MKRAAVAVLPQTLLDGTRVGKSDLTVVTLAVAQGPGADSRATAGAVRVQRGLLGARGGALRLHQAGRPPLRPVPRPGRNPGLQSAPTAQHHHRLGAASGDTVTGLTASSAHNGWNPVISLLCA